MKKDSFNKSTVEKYMSYNPLKSPQTYGVLKNIKQHA